MPAPSNMLGSVCRGNSEANVFQRGIHGTGAHDGGNNSLHRTVSDPTAGVALPPTNATAQVFDEVFHSKAVSETKTMLWEVKNFENVSSKGIERAMNFEFEVGRLGSMERHLPRRSRWRISLDKDNNDLALRVIQLSPENKVVFYQLNASIMHGSGIIGTTPQVETDFKIRNSSPHEGSGEIKLRGSNNVFSFTKQSSPGSDLCIQRYLSDVGSLFIKVQMEVLEDSWS